MDLDPLDTPVIETKVCKIGCQSPLCPSCAKGKSNKLFRKLLPIVKSWRHAQMWTFTFDPVQFPDQRANLEMVQKRRLLAEMMRKLWRLGLIEHWHYWWAMEPQMGERKTDDGPATEQMHFHVLLSPKGGYLSHELMVKIWGSFRPKEAGPVPEGRPPLGLVWYDNLSNTSDREALTKYCCKYVSKGGESGWPEYYLAMIDEGHRPRTTGQSQGFWDQLEPRPPRRKRSKTVTEYKLSEPDAEAKFEAECVKRLDPKPKKALGDKLRGCGEKAAIFEVVTPPDVDGVPQKRVYKHRGTANAPYGVIARYLEENYNDGSELLEGRNSFLLRPWEMNDLWARGYLTSGNRPPVDAPLIPPPGSRASREARKPPDLRPWIGAKRTDNSRKKTGSRGP